MHAMAYMHKSENQPVEVGSFFLLCGFQILNSGHLVWWYAPSPAGPLFGSKAVHLSVQFSSEETNSKTTHVGVPPFVQCGVGWVWSHRFALLPWQAWLNTSPKQLSVS